MNIMYSSSDSYAFLTGISMLSLLENNKTCDTISIYIMDNAISPENKNKLNQVARRYGRNIFYVPMPDLEQMTGQDINTRRWNISTFGRLYMASALPRSVHKVLNIDCDTIVEDSLEAIWNIDLDKKIWGGTAECMNDRYRRNIGLKKGDYYLNAGVVLMNLDEVRKYDYEQKFTNYIAQYGNSLAYLDQDVLNSIVEQEKKVKLPMRYNVLSIYYYATYKQLTQIRRSPIFYNEIEFADAIRNPALVHFTTCFLDGARPWIIGNMHPYRGKFLKYKSMSPWKNEPLKKNKKTIRFRMQQLIIKYLPKYILFEIASILHGVIVPEINSKKMRAAAK